MRGSPRRQVSFELLADARHEYEPRGISRARMCSLLVCHKVDQCHDGPRRRLSSPHGTRRKILPLSLACAQRPPDDDGVDGHFAHKGSASALTTRFHFAAMPAAQKSRRQHGADDAGMQRQYFRELLIAEDTTLCRRRRIGALRI